MVLMEYSTIDKNTFEKNLYLRSYYMLTFKVHVGGGVFLSPFPSKCNFEPFYS